MKTYVLWREQNNYKLQHTKEYNENICDARKIWTLRDFNTTEEVLQWLKTYWDIDREEIDIKC